MIYPEHEPVYIVYLPISTGRKGKLRWRYWHFLERGLVDVTETNCNISVWLVPGTGNED